MRARYERSPQRAGRAGVCTSCWTSATRRLRPLIHPNNIRRVVRALEMLDEGISYAEQQQGSRSRERLRRALRRLEMEREALYARIDARVDAMIARGPLGEVERLLRRACAMR